MLMVGAAELAEKTRLENLDHSKHSEEESKISFLLTTKLTARSGRFSSEDENGLTASRGERNVEGEKVKS